VRAYYVYNHSLVSNFIFEIKIHKLESTNKSKFEPMANYYRKGPTRASFWDYSSAGRYFITVITADRKPILGEIIDGKMIPPPIGKIVEQEWYLSFEIRKELFCDIFQLMPDHFHAIVLLDPDMNEGAQDLNVGGQDLNVGGQDLNVGAHGRTRLHSNPQTNPESYGVAYRSPKSISSFMAGFKSSATKKINVLLQTNENVLPTIVGRTFVPRTGFEPAHPCGRCDLNTVRLPISPPGQLCSSLKGLQM
jgi:putative transposase